MGQKKKKTQTVRWRKATAEEWRALVAAWGIAQSDLAALVGATRTTVFHWLRGSQPAPVYAYHSAVLALQLQGHPVDRALAPNRRRMVGFRRWPRPEGWQPADLVVDDRQGALDPGPISEPADGPTHEPSLSSGALSECKTSAEGEEVEKCNDSERAEEFEGQSTLGQPSSSDGSSEPADRDRNSSLSGCSWEAPADCSGESSGLLPDSGLLSLSLSSTTGEPAETEPADGPTHEPSLPTAPLSECKTSAEPPTAEPPAEQPEHGRRKKRGRR